MTSKSWKKFSSKKIKLSKKQLVAQDLKNQIELQTTEKQLNIIQHY